MTVYKNLFQDIITFDNYLHSEFKVIKTKWNKEMFKINLRKNNKKRIPQKIPHFNLTKEKRSKNKIR